MSLRSSRVIGVGKSRQSSFWDEFRCNSNVKDTVPVRSGGSATPPQSLTFELCFRNLSRADDRRYRQFEDKWFPISQQYHSCTTVYPSSHLLGAVHMLKYIVRHSDAKANSPSINPCRCHALAQEGLPSRPHVLAYHLRSCLGQHLPAAPRLPHTPLLSSRRPLHSLSKTGYENKEFLGWVGSGDALAILLFGHGTEAGMLQRH